MALGGRRLPEGLTAPSTHSLLSFCRTGNLRENWCHSANKSLREGAPEDDIPIPRTLHRMFLDVRGRPNSSGHRREDSREFMRGKGGDVCRLNWRLAEGLNGNRVFGTTSANNSRRCWGGGERVCWRGRFEGLTRCQTTIPKPSNSDGKFELEENLLLRRMSTVD